MRSFDVDGRMHVLDCKISKANVCPYYGREIPNSEQLGLEPNKIYKLYRDPAELERGAESFRNLQLMMAHVPVNATDPRIDITVGSVGSDVRFEAPYLVASLAVWTAEAIALIESRAQAQLSCSYRYTPDMTPGVTSDGVAYDGRMCNLIGNHVALVEEGRVGPDVVVNDASPKQVEKRTMKFPKLFASMIALGLIAKDSKPDALDSELEKIGAKDADLEEEAEKKKKADDEAAEIARKKADDESAPVTPGPKEGEVGAALDAALKTGKVVSADDAKALAQAAAVDAVTRNNQLHIARESVKPLVGHVALDSAEAVYKFALDKVGVKTEGIHPSAFGALVDSHKTALGARKPTAPTVAADAAAAMGEAIPGLARFNRA